MAPKLAKSEKDIDRKLCLENGGGKWINKSS